MKITEKRTKDQAKENNPSVEHLEAIIYQQKHQIKNLIQQTNISDDQFKETSAAFSNKIREYEQKIKDKDKDLGDSLMNISIIQKEAKIHECRYVPGSRKNYNLHSPVRSRS